MHKASGFARVLLLAALLAVMGIAQRANGSSCTYDSDCPKGQLCCLACGYFGCHTKACFAPMNGHCPLFP